MKFWGKKDEYPECEICGKSWGDHNGFETEECARRGLEIKRRVAIENEQIRLRGYATLPKETTQKDTDVLNDHVDEVIDTIPEEDSEKSLF